MPVRATRLLETPAAQQFTTRCKQRYAARRALFATRSHEREFLDDLTFDDASLERAFGELEKLNAWLGGHRTTIEGLHLGLSRLQPLDEAPIRVVDAGCGSGDGLRALARWARRRSLPLELIGVDGNPRVLELARRLSAQFPELTYRRIDVFSDAFLALRPRVVVASLFCHHFDTTTIERWLARLMEHSRVAVVINDLQRHWAAAYAFEGLCRLLRLSDIIAHDGSVSVRRGFREHELRELFEAVAPGRYTLRWRWAFRYQGVVWS